MTSTPRPLSDEVEFRRLCAEYKTACLAVCKALNVGRPPEPDKVLLFQQAEANAAAVLGRIKRLLGVTETADAA
jgi:hypothetical protein